MPKLKAILIDLDGTVYRGRKVLPGIPKAVLRLRQQGLRLVFISNASTHSRRQQCRRLRRMGIPCTPAEMYNSAYATARYLCLYHPRAVAYCISENGLQKELRYAGIKITSDPKRATVLATGLDRKLDYGKLTRGLQVLLRGAPFIASNADSVYPTERGFAPGSGSISAALAYASGRQPVVIGKPEPAMFQEILRQEKLNKNEVLVVGDNVETDGQAARRAGLRWVLVLGGVSKRKDVARLPIRQRPWRILNSLREIEKLTLQ